METLEPPRLLGPQEIRQLADHLGVSPTKKLGQNFLLDPNTVRMIVHAAGLNDEGVSEHVVEVGPGLGSLTLGLIDQAQHLTAIEIDQNLARQLPQTIADYAPDFASRFSLMGADALRISSTDLSNPTALVANLPYNVSVPVILHMLKTFPSIQRVLVMVQAEVADRLAAKPGSKVYGVPSVKAAFYGDVKRAGSIGKTVFWPAPKIDSGLVRIDCTRPYDLSLRQQVFPLIDAAFLQRRKTMRAALSGFYGSAAQAENALRRAGIDPAIRGEKLGINDFIRLAHAGGSDI
ncbi:MULTISPECIES: 16S rRNA (adenine(1518)-N(6)/adenine(1519)-N(6))-dimethyltransferase RsmA [unclassified Corynebacterium]|uniref:16S rRNA (adenine(1518)-N(6)/adenine(1519)-N(6))- dimethyltransferase RsmA n=1 Tax=unclassified Corynebacterium TaxID=2624378 RepID=UPI002168AB1A|nr:MULTISPECIES: 16S rRNA (adenine(1518)-N(6)/adenine(1519)-N(6))-dimethyltransferase RsmA [unclassified Corynebacterium]MCS4489987.1 16S rRNA (adenine(1518)-N(6)/adenine(1519)-N(6))-dimethyltransferase RsmA [Corynebacterium sp. ES2775-CONJ]MCS4531755.1 16S rRNA (adenine(1518)-N(6)/adenine(1519)-N(6))-dimethyltransferase RsmA [Corynebacterium sp. ES2730-CONJ]